MINPRILMQLPLIFLGSCVPITPSTSIIVYTGSATEASQVRTSDDSIKPKIESLREVPKSGTKESCKKMELSEVRAYKAPPIPNFDKVDSTDDQAVVDILLDDNATLRAEIRKFRLLYLCSLGEQMPK